MGIKLKNSKVFRIVNIIILITMIIILPIKVANIIKYKDYSKNIYNLKLISDYILDFDSQACNMLERYTDLQGNPTEEYLQRDISMMKSDDESAFKYRKDHIESEQDGGAEKASKEKIDMLLEEVKKEIIRSDEKLRADAISSIKNSFKDFKKDLIINNVNIEFYFENNENGNVITNVPGVTADDFDIDNNNDYEILELSNNNNKNINDNKNTENLYNIRLDISKNTQDDSGYNRYYRIPKKLLPGDWIYDIQAREDKSKEDFNRNRIMSVGIGVVLLLSLILALKNKRKANNGFFYMFQKIIPIEIKIISPILAIVNGYMMTIYVLFGRKIDIASLMVQAILLIISYLFISNLIANGTSKIDYENMKKRSIIYNIKVLTIKFIDSLKESFSINSTTIRLGIFIVMTVLAYIGAMFLHRYSQYEYYWYEKYVVAYEILYQIIIIIYVFNFSKRLNLLKLNTDKIVEGNYDVEIEVKGPRIVKEIAANIKNIESGFSKAVDDGIKSEKLKGELITNVSHDLKTPLTSIISYVDLLKNENLKEVDRIKYINVLDRKAQRLKVLIEDLFEASKAASGSIELQKENIDVTSLLRQTLGEFQEKISASSLEFINKWPEEKAELYLDGKKTWRVFENLISNIIKYSMKNSRVYIDVIKNIDNVQIVMKNISAYQLDFTEEEVIERFKRGDKSRNTEGSGLGLSIAKSLTNLQGGTLKIEIDGDLFKVILTFPSK
ncbi:sensor histidine kinase [Clostridium gasigenes]|uniref:histidine kinase n=1 Tax=Clostridium gasigenes TaxID=94869 RepID=A0A1H0TMH1_9CLOT|nr:sensor histidine kinase [Clostridium gasigenes]SDP55189.1 Signal transduction histidine kinase [Clostridium gasigenes]